jgi:hypothetical protein
MLRRTGFKRATFTPPPPAPLRPATRRATYAKSSDVGIPISKECASQSLAYQKAAKDLGYCMRCGWIPPWGTRLDFCHRDQGKGTGIKTDVRHGWPGCRLCHDFVGASGSLPKAERRALEDELGAKTRAAILAAGTWPENLPKWSDA